MIDTHCHLYFDEINSEEVMSKLHENNIESVINIGARPDEAEKVIEFSKAHKNAYATAGVHPCDADMWNDEIAKKYESYGDQIIGIGETGLDYFKYDGDREVQKKAFKEQRDLAKKMNIPLVVHIRDENGECEDDAIKILKDAGPFVIHCFTASQKFCDQVLSLGGFISITGIVTFKNATKLQEIVKTVPLNRIMLETDSPFLAPDPYRGKVNTPLYIGEVCKKIAEIKGVSSEKIDKITTKNAKEFWKI